jgi:hypothetical protein
MRKELENYRYFDIINNEKMTPRFLSLAKVEKKSESLKNIKNDTGTVFDTDAERTDYIRNFYAKIYKAPNANDILPDNCIENFFGEEICSNPIVNGSKLTRDEQILFDNPISIQELDKAVQELNVKSAGSADGISTKFLRMYWGLFRLPFFNYATYCFENKRLSQSFNSASIKLIPKKGDTSQLKNWRPISLLNSCFKITSKAIDNRLKKLTDIVLSRAQKGFTDKRYIHECIINVVTSIEHCERNGIPAFVLGLDMAKAFDTVRHDYMNHVYKFFGVGENFINMLNVKRCFIFTHYYSHNVYAKNNFKFRS